MLSIFHNFNFNLAFNHIKILVNKVHSLILPGTLRYVYIYGPFIYSIFPVSNSFNASILHSDSQQQIFA